jgi:glycosyltransferase involved in cell wall biosynthesis
VKVLFLTKYPEEGASSRYRVYQYLPYLDAAGIDYDVRPFMSPAMYRRMMRSGATVGKALDTLTAVVKRVLALQGAKRYDLVYMQRECLPFGGPWLERSLRRQGIRTVFDYDDALFIFKGSTHNKLADRFKRPDKYREIFALADCVLAGNDWLRDQAAEHCRDARTFYVAEDLERYTPRPPHAEGEKVVIGWLGSPSTEKYLRLIEPALREVCTRHPRVRLKVIGGGAFRPEGIPVEQVPWTMDTEVPHLHGFDIGIMPLPLEEWSKGKSGGKARTYMAVGLPVVCTGIGFNRELIRDGETGFLVETTAEWTESLSKLVESPGLRQRVGDAARREVEERYSLQRLGPEFVRILEEITTR